MSVHRRREKPSQFFQVHSCPCGIYLGGVTTRTARAQFLDMCPNPHRHSKISPGNGPPPPTQDRLERTAHTTRRTPLPLSHLAYSVLPARCKASSKASLYSSLVPPTPMRLGFPLKHRSLRGFLRRPLSEPLLPAHCGTFLPTDTRMPSFVVWLSGCLVARVSFAIVLSYFP